MKLTIKTLYLIFFCTRVLLKYSIKLFLLEIFAIKNNMSEKNVQNCHTCTWFNDKDVRRCKAGICSTDHEIPGFIQASMSQIQGLFKDF